MDSRKVAQELVAVAKLLAADTFKCPDCGTKVLEQTGYCVKCKKKVKKAGEADVYDKLRDLVISRTPAEYAKAANLVKSNRRIEFDYMKKLYKALSELSKMQEAMERKHKDMWELWSEVGRREAQVSRYTRR